MKERKAYIVLVVICLIMTGAGLFFGARQVQANNHKFCDVFNALIETPAQRPAHPKADPSRERSYLIYLKFVQLDHNLGCD